MNDPYFLAWWNLENLFDVESSRQRPAWLKGQLRSSLRGWTASVLQIKINQLASIIGAMNGGRGPDLLGVCEVENEPVLKRLVRALAPLGRDYGIAHHDTSDHRGIDVAFIYDRARFTANKQFFHVVQKRPATRALFQVNFTTVHGSSLILIGNHWPARSAGKFESEPFRILAAETLSYFLEKIPEKFGRETNVLVMGDFNDEPWDRSLTDYALSTRERTKVESVRARSPYLYNMMWAGAAGGIGTYHYGGAWLMLDQTLINRSLARGSESLALMDNSLEIFSTPEMREGSAGAPRRFGLPGNGGGIDPRGFSDHFPVTMRLTETHP